MLKEGVIQQVDTPTALYDYPANAFVASFIGSPEMNIVTGQLMRHDDGVVVELGGQVFRLPISKAEQFFRVVAQMLGVCDWEAELDLGEQFENRGRVDGANLESTA